MGFNSKAFILSKREIGENNLAVTFFTESHGKIDLLAKGARKSKKRFQGKLEADNIYYIEFSKKSEDQIGSLIKIEISSEKYIEFDGTNLILKSFIFELINNFEINEYPNIKVFKMMETYINKKYSKETLKLTIKIALKYLKELGILPSIENCYKCKIKLNKISYFDISNGGNICANCSKNLKELIKLKKGSIIISEIKNKIDIQKQFLQLLVRFSEFHSGKKFNSAQYLQI